jgi:ubiquinone/menaquinone biosynthesis C-methylase UbiE
VNIKFRKYLAKALYWYVSRVDTSADITFMNYGYSDQKQEIDLTPEEEPNRYPIQLYHHIAENIDFRNKALVEVGCGRGGGLFYIVKRWSPYSATGIDISKTSVRFCNDNFKIEGLTFLHGDAQHLPFENQSCDIVINVESSHRYENFEGFLTEVHRILCNGGLFLLADYRSKKKLPGLRDAIKAASFRVVKEEFINQQVVSALQLNSDRKRLWVKKLAPFFLHTIGRLFADAIESKLIEKFSSNRKLYFYYILQK